MSGADAQGWYLEGRLSGESVQRRFSLRTFPVWIGRAMDADVSLPVGQVSTRHAEIDLEDGRLRLRDLGSSNGTFVNRLPVAEPVFLRSGDVVHFADIELLVGHESDGAGDFLETCVMAHSPAIVATGTHSRARALRALVDASRVSVVFQPIASLDGTGATGFEVLGRGACGELPESPGALFEIAEEAELASELSRAFRETGLGDALALPGTPRIFTNVHPAELDDGTFVATLAKFRERVPWLPLTAEIHESTVTDAAAMRRLRANLVDLDVEVAYDDFGAGQARLLELADCPPDCLKFDRALIRDLDTAPAHRQRMIETLARIARDMGVTVLAEGIEHVGELEACRAAGFQLAQGYFIARPAPVERWRHGWSWDPSRGAAPAGGAAPQRTTSAAR